MVFNIAYSNSDRVIRVCIYVDSSPINRNFCKSYKDADAADDKKFSVKREFIVEISRAHICFFISLMIPYSWSIKVSIIYSYSIMTDLFSLLVL